MINNVCQCLRNVILIKVSEYECFKNYKPLDENYKCAFRGETTIESFYFQLDKLKEGIFWCTIEINEEKTIKCYINGFKC